MALRATETEDPSSSPLPCKPYFSQDAEKPPSTDWEQWIELFELSMRAKTSTSITGINTTPTEEEPHVSAMLGNLTLQAATRKAVSLLYIRIGEIRRKMLMDKYPNIRIFVIEQVELMENC